MHPLDWLIVLVLNGSVIGCGFYLSRGTTGSSEWFLGRRSLPWWAIGLSMFATNVDNADIVSVTGKTYSSGLHILSVYAIGSAVGGIVAAFCIVPVMYRAGCYTNSEYLEARFGTTTRVLSALIQVQYRSSMLGLMLYAVYVLLTGLEIVGPTAAWVLIVVMVVCSGLYTAWGGLKAVVWTDAMQGVVMMVGCLTIFGAVWNAVGGWSGMEQTLAEYDRGHDSSRRQLLHIGQYDGSDDGSAPYSFEAGRRRIDPGPWLVVLGWTIVGTGYWTVNHTQTMRLMGARSLWDMRMAAVAGVALSLPVMLAVACLGVFARAIPGMEAVADSDQLYPRLVDTYLGVGLKGLVVAGIVAAAISTVDSMGSALSAILTRDIYARLLVPDRSDQHYVVVGRCATVCVLLLGFGYLPFILLQKDMLDAFTTLIPVFVTPLLTLYLFGGLTRVHRRSGLVGLLVGSAYGVFALYCREAPRLGWPELDAVPVWLTGRWAAFSWSFLTTSVAMLATTAVLGTDPRTTAQTLEHAGWLERSRENLPVVRSHPFPHKVPWWAQPALYAIVLMAGCLYVVFGVFW